MITFALAALIAAQTPSEIDTPGLARAASDDAQPELIATTATETTPPIITEPTTVHVETPPEHRTFLDVSGVGGVGAGVLIIPAPAPFAAPWAGFAVEVERKVFKSSFIGADFAFTLGDDESGKPIGGYHLLGHAGTAWIDSRFFILETQLRGGLTSFLLVPLPQLGGVGTVMFQPFRGDIFRWRLGLDAGLDFVLFLPVFSGALFSELRWQVGHVYVGLKLTGGYSLGILNGVGVAASARLTGGVSF